MRAKKGLILILIFILTFIATNLVMTKSVQAVTQIRSTDIDKIDEEKYPGVKQMIKDLQEKHPNWNFKVLYTELDWYEVLKNEYVNHGESPRNLVPVGNSFTGEWICEICKSDSYYDNGNWRCASVKALQYMMDPRNSINYSDIFQFMELSYQECTIESIKPMVAGTFLDNESYINTILKAGLDNNVSPYYIVALAVQEQGASGSSTISGKYPGHEGYYNIFNINASGNGSGTIITKALTYAKNNGWNTLEKSIEGGVKEIAKSYIGRGQDTLYLQKFDVDNSDGKLYWHQYQQNIMAAQNEGVTIRKIFEDINSVESAYTFVIPLYLNTPQEVQGKPLKDKVIEPENAEKVKLNVRTSINLRSTPNGDVIGTLYANEIVYRLEKAQEKVAGTYWDKVMKENGVIGYVARETYDYESTYKLYLIPIEEEKPEENPDETPEQNPDKKPEETPDENPGENPDQNPETPPEENKELPDASNEKIKVEPESKQVTITPETTLQEIIDLVGKDVTAKDKDGNVLGKTSILGTGSVINDEYTVVMLGDVNGDATVDVIDLALVKRHLMETQKLNGAYYEAGIIQKEGIEIDVIDLALLKRVLMGNATIGF